MHDRETFERGLRGGMERVVQLSAESGEAPPPAYEAGSGGRRSDGGVRGDGEEEEERLVVPDVRHVMPPRYEDVHEGGKPCKRTLKERILRRKSGCAGAAQKEGVVVR